MTPARILLVDDEPDFLRAISDVLKNEGYTLLTATNGVDAVKTAKESLPDLILLDWNLPLKDGVAVCRELKNEDKTRAIPVIMLTARGRETDTVLGLEMGATDFVTKRSLRPRELVARVRAALRDKTGAPGEGSANVSLRSGGITLDTNRREVIVHGRLVRLRVKEFDVLWQFLKKPGHVFTRRYLMEAVWGDAYLGTSRTIDTTVAGLRVALGESGQRIESIKGVGYKLNEPQEDPSPHR